jgi:hypothetical protein
MMIEFIAKLIKNWRISAVCGIISPLKSQPQAG